MSISCVSTKRGALCQAKRKMLSNPETIATNHTNAITASTIVVSCGAFSCWF